MRPRCRLLRMQGVLSYEGDDVARRRSVIANRSLSEWMDVARCVDCRLSDEACACGPTWAYLEEWHGDAMAE